MKNVVHFVDEAGRNNMNSSVCFYCWTLYFWLCFVISAIVSFFPKRLKKIYYFLRVVYSEWKSFLNWNIEIGTFLTKLPAYELADWFALLYIPKLFVSTLKRSITRIVSILKYIVCYLIVRHYMQQPATLTKIQWFYRIDLD